jgi:hypothetical protein
MAKVKRTAGTKGRNRQPWERRLPLATLLRSGRKAVGTSCAVLEEALKSAPRAQSPFEKAVGGIVATVVRRGRLAARLLDHDHLPEAAVIARTIIDLTISYFYLLEPSDGAAKEHRASRFLAFDPVQCGQLSDKWTRSGRSAAINQNDRTERRKAIGVFADLEERATLGWAGISTDQMIRSLTDKGARQIINTLRVNSFLFSGCVHPTPLATRMGGFEVFLATEVPITVCECLVVIVAALAFPSAIDSDKGRRAILDALKICFGDFTRWGTEKPRRQTDPLPLFSTLKKPR